MEPLFGSTPRQPKQPHMSWRIWAQKEIVGKPFRLSGRVVTLDTHRVGRRTLPCLGQWPRLNVECPHCDRSRRSTCWVPLVACFAPWKRVIAMGAETTDKSLEPLKLGDVIEGHMALMLKPTIIFRRYTGPLALAIAEGAAKQIGEDKGDITRWLLHYWQWPELSMAFGQLYRESLKRRAQRERAQISDLDVLTGPSEFHAA